MKRIAIIGAGGYDWWSEPNRKPFFDRVTPPGFELVGYNPEFGTHAVECRIDEAYNAPHILKQIVKADHDQVDVMVIDCVGDPALESAREITSIPVVGVRKATLHLALTLGNKFTLITIVGPQTQKWMEHCVRAEGLEPFCASVLPLKLAVLEISKKPQQAQQEIREICQTAIARDGADVMVLGCTGLSAEVDLAPIKAEFGVPILDPLEVGIRTAALLVAAGLTHSKVAYPNPTRKPMTEDPVLEHVFDHVIKA